MALSAFLALLFSTTLWLRLIPTGDFTEIGAGFFLTVAASWAILIPAKFWSGQPGDSALHRTIMMLLGVLVGGKALWLDGWNLASLPIESSEATSSGTLPFAIFRDREGLAMAAGYLSYFGLAFFALRWWKMADRLRSHRFSLVPILAAGFWALALLFVWPNPSSPRGAVALVLAAVIVQWVSPWEPPPLPAVKLACGCAARETPTRRRFAEMAMVVPFFMLIVLPVLGLMVFAWCYLCYRIGCWLVGGNSRRPRVDYTRPRPIPQAIPVHAQHDDVLYMDRRRCRVEEAEAECL